MTTTTPAELAEAVHEFVRRDFHPHFGEFATRFAPSPFWRRLRELGSELWLDTGDVQAAGENWTAEFTALTTNNTLLNREVQKGTYDALVPEAAELLGHWQTRRAQRVLEIAFILNAVHALKLVERFDAYVSVEEHTALADDVDAAVEVAAALLRPLPGAVHRQDAAHAGGAAGGAAAGGEGIPVNQTLGFSARQNYLMPALARPAFVNVFLGRLSSFVADNGLGDGALVGERATLASQSGSPNCARACGLATRQIAASFRAGQQVSRPGRRGRAHHAAQGGRRGARPAAAPRN